MAEQSGNTSSVVGSAGVEEDTNTGVIEQSSTGGGGVIDDGVGSTGGAGSTGSVGSSASSTGGPVLTSTSGSTASAVTSTAGSTGNAAVKGVWPDNWRETASKGDAKLAARLGRYASPQDVVDALITVQDRIAKGELRSALPKNATPEQITAWRAEQGVPESAEKYEIKLTDGAVIGDKDKPIIDGFLKDAHGLNLNNAQASGAVDWYYKEIERQGEERDQQDRETQQRTEDTLREEWGKDFRTNMTIATNLLATAPAGFSDQFLHGRLADGTPMGSSPEGLRWLAMMARQINPQSTVVPNAGNNVAGAIDGEIKTIEGHMKFPRGTPEGDKYWKDEKLQARYRDLLAARDAAKSH